MSGILDSGTGTYDRSWEQYELPENAQVFEINDISLKIPPTNIAVSQEDLFWKWKTLRSKQSTKVPSGHGMCLVRTTIVFTPDLLLDLHRLIVQFRHSPFCFVENKYIRQTVCPNFPVYQNMHFVMTNLHVSPMKGNPGTFVCELDMKFFNYFPFSPNLLYRIDWETFPIKTEGESMPAGGWPVYSIDTYVGPADSTLKLLELQSAKTITNYATEGSALTTWEPMSQNEEIAGGATLDTIMSHHIGEIFDMVPLGQSMVPSYWCSNPKYSKIYVRFINSLQQKALWRNFGIDAYGDITSAKSDAYWRHFSTGNNEDNRVFGLHTGKVPARVRKRWLSNFLTTMTGIDFYWDQYRSLEYSQEIQAKIVEAKWKEAEETSAMNASFGASAVEIFRNPSGMPLVTSQPQKDKYKSWIDYYNSVKSNTVSDGLTYGLNGAEVGEHEYLFAYPGGRYTHPSGVQWYNYRPNGTSNNRRARQHWGIDIGSICPINKTNSSTLTGTDGLGLNAGGIARIEANTDLTDWYTANSVASFVYDWPKLIKDSGDSTLKKALFAALATNDGSTLNPQYFTDPSTCGIYSVYDGEVVVAGTPRANEEWKYNLGSDIVVVIRHNIGGIQFHSIYRHNYKTVFWDGINFRQLNVGDTVSRGQIIAWGGNRGASGGVHLHFEIDENYDGVNCPNPIPFLLTKKNGSVATPQEAERIASGANLSSAPQGTPGSSAQGPGPVFSQDEEDALVDMMIVLQESGWQQHNQTRNSNILHRPFALSISPSNPNTRLSDGSHANFGGWEPKDVQYRIVHDEHVVVTNCAGSLQHVVSSIPILGYEFPTSQHLGSVEPNYMVEFALLDDFEGGLEGIGRDGEIIAGMREDLAHNSRDFRQVVDSHTLCVNHFITRLLGSYVESGENSAVVWEGEDELITLRKKFIISRMDWMTIEGHPGLSSLTMEISETNPYYEDELILYSGESDSMSAEDRKKAVLNALWAGTEGGFRNTPQERWNGYAQLGSIQTYEQVLSEHGRPAADRVVAETGSMNDSITFERGDYWIDRGGSDTRDQWATLASTGYDVTQRYEGGGGGSTGSHHVNRAEASLNAGHNGLGRPYSRDAEGNRDTVDEGMRYVHTGESQYSNRGTITPTMQVPMPQSDDPESVRRHYAWWKNWAREQGIEYRMEGGVIPDDAWWWQTEADPVEMYLDYNDVLQGYEQQTEYHAGRVVGVHSGWQHDDDMDPNRYGSTATPNMDIEQMQVAGERGTSGMGWTGSQNIETYVPDGTQFPEHYNPDYYNNAAPGDPIMRPPPWAGEAWEAANSGGGWIQRGTHYGDVSNTFSLTGMHTHTSERALEEIEAIRSVLVQAVAGAGEILSENIENPSHSGDLSLEFIRSECYDLPIEPRMWGAFLIYMQNMFPGWEDNSWFRWGGSLNERISPSYDWGNHEIWREESKHWERPAPNFWGQAVNGEYQADLVRRANDTRTPWTDFGLDLLNIPGRGSWLAIGAAISWAPQALEQITDFWSSDTGWNQNDADNTIEQQKDELDAVVSSVLDTYLGTTFWSESRRSDTWVLEWFPGPIKNFISLTTDAYFNEALGHAGTQLKALCGYLMCIGTPNDSMPDYDAQTATGVITNNFPSRRPGVWQPAASIDADSYASMIRMKAEYAQTGFALATSAVFQGGSGGNITSGNQWGSGNSGLISIDDSRTAEYFGGEMASATGQWTKIGFTGPGAPHISKWVQPDELAAYQQMAVESSAFNIETLTTGTLQDVINENILLNPPIIANEAWEMIKLGNIKEFLSNIADRVLAKPVLMEILGLGHLMTSDLGRGEIAGLEAYPDLDLPGHPFYGHELYQMRPDFYYWNPYDDLTGSLREQELSLLQEECATVIQGTYDFLKSMQDEGLDTSEMEERMAGVRTMGGGFLDPRGEWQSGKRQRDHSRLIHHPEGSDNVDYITATADANAAQGSHGELVRTNLFSSGNPMVEGIPTGSPGTRTELGTQLPAEESPASSGPEAYDALISRLVTWSKGKTEDIKSSISLLPTSMQAAALENANFLEAQQGEIKPIPPMLSLYDNSALYPATPGTETQRIYGEYVEKINEMESMFGNRMGYLGAVVNKNTAHLLEDVTDTYMANLQQYSHGFNPSFLNEIARDSAKDILAHKKSMCRAFPTFKLYFVEEDELESRSLVFDDFYSYNGVKEFTIHSSRKQPADTAIITVQNVSGTLDGTKRGVITDVDHYALNPDGSRKHSQNRLTDALEQARGDMSAVTWGSTNEVLSEVITDAHLQNSATAGFGAVLLRPGLNVQLRAGYSNDPGELEVLISGRIVDLQWSTQGDLCQLTVQSFGTELVQMIKNATKKWDPYNTGTEVFDQYPSTHRLLGSMMLQPELKHFGRWKKNQYFQYGEAKDSRLDFTEWGDTAIDSKYKITNSLWSTAENNLVWVLGAAAVTAAAIRFGQIKSIPGLSAVGGATTRVANTWPGRLAGKIGATASGLVAAGRSIVPKGGIFGRSAQAIGWGMNRLTGMTGAAAAKLRIWNRFNKVLGTVAQRSELYGKIFAGLSKNGGKVATKYMEKSAKLWGIDGVVVGTALTQKQAAQMAYAFMVQGALSRVAIKSGVLRRTIANNPNAALGSARNLFFASANIRGASILSKAGLGAGALRKGMASSFNSPLFGSGVKFTFSNSSIQKMLASMDVALVNQARHSMVLAQFGFVGRAPANAGMVMRILGGLGRVTTVGLWTAPIAATSFLGIAGTATMALDTINNATFGRIYDKTIGQWQRSYAKIMVHMYLSPQDDNLYAPSPKDYLRVEDYERQSWLKAWATPLINIADDYKILGSGNNVRAGIDKIKALWDPDAVLSDEIPTWIIQKRIRANDISYTPRNTSIWKIFHEMSLRHPGWIYGCRPYGKKFRYTMFFGVPSQRYWAKPASNSFVYRMNRLREFIVGNNISSQLYDSLYGAGSYAAVEEEMNQTQFIVDVNSSVELKRFAGDNEGTFISYWGPDYLFALWRKAYEVGHSINTSSNSGYDFESHANTIGTLYRTYANSTDPAHAQELANLEDRAARGDLLARDLLFYEKIAPFGEDNNPTPTSSIFDDDLAYTTNSLKNWEYDALDAPGGFGISGAGSHDDPTPQWVLDNDTEYLELIESYNNNPYRVYNNDGSIATHRYEAYNTISGEDMETVDANLYNGTLNSRLKIRAMSEYIKGLEHRFIPFRRYHMITSEEDIVANNIISSEHNVINAVNVNFYETPNTPGAAPTPVDSVKMKAHSNIPDHMINMGQVDYPNCKGRSAALRYGIASLMYGMRDMYRGELLVMGQPRIRPWDVCYLLDSYHEMMGPFEVEAVTHMFSFETGFLTEIKPSAIVIGNEISSWPVLEALKLYVMAMRDKDHFNTNMNSNASDDGRDWESLYATDDAYFTNKYGERFINPNGSHSIENLYQEVENDLRMVDPFGEIGGGIDGFLQSTLGVGAGGLTAWTTRSTLIAGGNIASHTRIADTPVFKWASSPGNIKWTRFAAGGIALGAGAAMVGAVTDWVDSPDLAWLVATPIIFQKALQEECVTVIPLVKSGTPIVSGLQLRDPLTMWRNVMGMVRNIADDTSRGMADMSWTWGLGGYYQAWKNRDILEGALNTGGVNRTGM